MGEFRGSAPAKIDDRGRLKVPTGFRRNLDDTYGVDVFVTSIRGDCTHIYPLEVWDDIEKQLARLPRTASAKRRFLERVSYYGQQGRLDAQGRIVIPPILRESAGMVGEVVVLGLQDHLEVWNRDRFETRLRDEPFTDDDLDALTVL
ncbi:MAG: division/cell wall cluster transcriptional repressor MraZ [Thermoanaerobaculia bacterium]|nr:division/cell wall cluster transcriptional repressor MraZ [Thermoanaerobaculia bacterium]